MNNNEVSQTGSSAGIGTGKLLAVDTSTSSMSIALLEGGRLLKEINTAAERNHSIYLMPNIQEALAELGWSPKQLEGIAVGRGPGSYTGVRIGVTVAKTMAWSLGIPVVGVSSLEAMAAGAYRSANAGVGVGVGAVVDAEGDSVRARVTVVEAGRGNQAGETAGADAGSLAVETAGTDARSLAGETAVIVGVSEAAGSTDVAWVVPLVNARRGQAFTALFRFDGSSEDASQGMAERPAAMDPVGHKGWSRESDDGIRQVATWTEEMLGELERIGITDSKKLPGQVLFVGETEEFIPIIEQFSYKVHELGRISTKLVDYRIQAEFIGYLGYQSIQQGHTDEVHHLLPNYTQLAEAEANLLNKQGKG